MGHTGRPGKLRLVDKKAREAARERQSRLFCEPAGETGTNVLNDRRRFRHLFVGLIRCGCPNHGSLAAKGAKKASAKQGAIQRSACIADGK